MSARVRIRIAPGGSGAPGQPQPPVGAVAQVDVQAKGHPAAEGEVRAHVGQHLQLELVLSRGLVGVGPRVLRAAVAYSLAGDDAALTRLEDSSLWVREMDGSRKDLARLKAVIESGAAPGSAGKPPASRAVAR